MPTLLNAVNFKPCEAAKTQFKGFEFKWVDSHLTVWNCFFLLLHYSVTDPAVPHGVHVSEVISGHGAAGRPRCYHSLADLRSAVCAASPGTSGLFFPPLRPHPLLVPPAPTAPRLSHLHHTHLLTEEDQHYAVPVLVLTTSVMWLKAKPLKSWILKRQHI